MYYDVLVGSNCPRKHKSTAFLEESLGLTYSSTKNEAQSIGNEKQICKWPEVGLLPNLGFNDVTIDI